MQLCYTSLIPKGAENWLEVALKWGWLSTHIIARRLNP